MVDGRFSHLDATADAAVGGALLRLLRRTGGSIAIDADPAVAAAAVAAECAQLVEGGECMVIGLSPAHEHLVVLGTHGTWAARYAGSTWPSAGTLARSALDAGHPVEQVGPADGADGPSPFTGRAMGAVRMIPLPQKKGQADAAAASTADAVSAAVLAVFRPDEVPFSPAQCGIIDACARVLADAVPGPIVVAAADARSRDAADRALHDLVHDLRGHLTVMAGYAEMLQEGVFGKAPEAWSTPIDVISTQVAELGLLVDGMLGRGNIEHS